MIEGYGKINPETGFLMSCIEKHEDDWLPLDSFAKDANGRLHVYYVNQNTPHVENNAEEAHQVRSRKASIMLMEAGMTVVYKDNTYDVTVEGQAKIASNLAILSTNPVGTTRNFFTAKGKEVQLTKEDFASILALADAEHAKAMATVAEEEPEG